MYQYWYEEAVSTQCVSVQAIEETRKERSRAVPVWDAGFCGVAGFVRSVVYKTCYIRFSEVNFHVLSTGTYIPLMYSGARNREITHALLCKRKNIILPISYHKHYVK